MFFSAEVPILIRLWSTVTTVRTGSPSVMMRISGQQKMLLWYVGKPDTQVNTTVVVCTERLQPILCVERCPFVIIFIEVHVH